MIHLTSGPEFNTIPQNSIGGWTMKGGYYLDKRRQRYRVYFPWKGKRLWFNHYGANRVPLYEEGGGRMR